MTDSKFDRAGFVLGNEIRQLRSQKGLSQAELAYRCGVQRTTINMIEKGKRNPSMELLRSLVANLAHTPDETRRIIYASIGDDPEQAPPTYLPLTQQDPLSNVDLWIFSDALAENVLDDPRWLNATIDDVKKGKIRYYFLPAHRCEFERNQFLQELNKRDIDKESYSSTVKFFALQYPFSALFYFLRLAVINPHRDRGDSADSIEITVGEDEGVRVPLSKSQVSQIMIELNGILKVVNSEDGYPGIKEI